MTIKIRLFSFPALLITAVVFGAAGTAPVLAEDAFSNWGSVDDQALSAERGKAFELDESALATAVGAQYQYVNFPDIGEVGPGGEITLGSHTFANQVMSLNVMNTGSNVAMQHQNVIAVTVIDSTVAAP
ncbi:hypothetical protein [Pelagibius sp.]|uniref:hypothetical protein n=1 Tax=Pelagibius sp. TaxID=1931238 RepID=UPI003BAFCAA4